MYVAWCIAIITFVVIIIIDSKVLSALCIAIVLCVCVLQLKNFTLEGKQPQFYTGTLVWQELDVRIK